MGHPLYLLTPLLSRGAVSIEGGDPAQAQADLSEALALARRIGYGQQEAVSLLFFGWLEAVQGNRDSSECLIAESRALAVRLGGEGAARGFDVAIRAIRRAADPRPPIRPPTGRDVEHRDMLHIDGERS